MLNPDHFANILIFSKPDNVTVDYYIAPRLSEEAWQKTKIIDPRFFEPQALPIEDQKTAVIINRYFTWSIVRWILANKNQIKALIWVVDDDFRSMVTDRSIPMAIKRRPLITMLLYPLIRNNIDLLIASTKDIAETYSTLTSKIQPPIYDLSKSAEKPLNCKKLYYFAKMHKAEHEFLYPIIKDVLEQDPELSFTVIATGDLKQYWERLPRVTALPELSYPDYCSYIEALPEGGLFLVPLLQSSLNQHRSSAKLLEVARTSSSPILANHPEFEASLEGCEMAFLPPNPNVWKKAILKASHQPEQSALLAKKLRERLHQIYHQREMIL